jgi:hypothetical protein
MLIKAHEYTKKLIFLAVFGSFLAGKCRLKHRDLETGEDIAGFSDGMLAGSFNAVMSPGKMNVESPGEG